MGSEWSRGLSKRTGEDQVQGHLSQVAQGHGLQTERGGHAGFGGTGGLFKQERARSLWSERGGKQALR